MALLDGVALSQDDVKSLCVLHFALEVEESKEKLLRRHRRYNILFLVHTLFKYNLRISESRPSSLPLGYHSHLSNSYSLHRSLASANVQNQH